MHDHEAEGNKFFRCDFCATPWAEERPMVEGHRGSLICAPCLGVGLAELATGPAESAAMPEGASCTLCLREIGGKPAWASPVRDEVLACGPCLKRSARMLMKDPDTEWSPPPGAGA